MIKTFESCLDLLKVFAFYVKLESSSCRIYCVNLPSLIDQELDSIDRKSCRLFFCRISNLTQVHMTCRVLCFALSIKGKNLAMFFSCFLCCVYESLVRSRGVCLHIYLGLSISRLMSRAWWSLQLLHKKLKEKHKWEYLWLLWIQERSSPWTRSCHMVVIVSFLLKVAIEC